MLKEKCNTTHLMGNIYIGRPPVKILPKTNKDDKETVDNLMEEETEEARESKKKERMEIEKQYKIYFAQRRRRNADLRARTENADLAEPIELDSFLGSLISGNRAVHTHLIAFCSITHYATINHCRIGYGEYRKRISKDSNIKREWCNIRTWLTKNTTHNITAATIGIGKRGYVYIRFLTTNYKDIAVYDVANDLGYYLRHKKHYTPVEFKPYEKDMMQFIEDKYNNDDVQNIEGLINWIPNELYQIMRASFVLPHTHRTFKNTGANHAINDNSCSVSYNNIRQGWNQQVSQKAFSSFLEKDGDDYSSPFSKDDMEPNEDEIIEIDEDMDF